MDEDEVKRKPDGGSKDPKGLAPRLIAFCLVLLAAMAALLHPASAVDRITFEDVTARSGIEFVLQNSATPEKHQIETMVGGVALFDYDGDGLLDIFFTNGAQQPALAKDDPRFWNRLYRNKGNGVFEDVTARAGVRGEGYSMAAAVGDYDDDGRPDLFVAGRGRKHCIAIGAMARLRTSQRRPEFATNLGRSAPAGSMPMETVCSIFRGELCGLGATERAGL